MYKTLFLGALIFVSTVGGHPARSAEQIGVALTVVNAVEGSIDGQSRKINVKDDVFFAEHVTTGADGATEFVFKDETVLQLGPDSDISLDEFVYDPSDQNSVQKLALTLGVGTFRFVSGKMNKKAYEINVPFGQLGVRGTSLAVHINLDRVAEIYVEEGSVVVRDKDGKETIFSKGTKVILSASGMKSHLANIQSAAISLYKLSLLNTVMLGAGTFIPHRAKTLAANAKMSHDVYEEGCH